VSIYDVLKIGLLECSISELVLCGDLLLFTFTTAQLLCGRLHMLCICYVSKPLGVIHKGRPHRGGGGGRLNADRGGRVIDDADVRKKYYIG